MLRGEGIPAHIVHDQHLAKSVKAKDAGQDVLGDAGGLGEVELVPSGGGQGNRTVLNFLTGDLGKQPRNVGVGDKFDSYRSTKILKNLPTKRKEPEVEKEGIDEPDRKKKKGTPLQGKKDPRSEMKDKMFHIWSCMAYCVV